MLSIFGSPSHSVGKTYLSNVAFLLDISSICCRYHIPNIIACVYIVTCELPILQY